MSTLTQPVIVTLAIAKLASAFTFSFGFAMKTISAADYEIIKKDREQLVDDLRQNEVEAFSYLTRKEAELLHAKVRRLDVLLRAHEKSRMH